MIMLKGHCECGRINFVVDGEIKELSHCHCSQCRRLHGAAYASYASVARKQFRYLNEGDELKEFASSANLTRVFCNNCGSNIMVIASYAPKKYYLAMGVLDGDPVIPEPFHIFVKSKAPWHNITDDAMQYDRDITE